MAWDPTTAEWEVTRSDDWPHFENENGAGVLRRRPKTGLKKVTLGRSFTFRTQADVDDIYDHYNDNFGSSFSLTTQWDNGGKVYATCYWESISSSRPRYGEITVTMTAFALVDPTTEFT